jgi:hypothetical protein
LSKAIEEIEPKLSANLTQSARILKRMEECSLKTVGILWTAAKKLA